MTYLFFVLIWFVCGISATFFGAQKGHGCLCFFLGFALGPLGLIIALLVEDERKQSTHIQDSKKCPFCAEMIKKEAIVCRYCGRDLPQETTSKEDNKQQVIDNAQDKKQSDLEGIWKIAQALIAIIFIIIISFFIINQLETYRTNKNVPSYIASHSWKDHASNLVSRFNGNILSIEQLNSDTCWAVLDSTISNERAVTIAENIGQMIRNEAGKEPLIHVFVRGKHIVVARPLEMNYVGSIEIADWNPSAFEGKYRPK